MTLGFLTGVTSDVSVFPVAASEEASGFFCSSTFKAAGLGFFTWAYGLGFG